MPFQLEMTGATKVRMGQGKQGKAPLVQFVFPTPTAADNFGGYLAKEYGFYGQDGETPKKHATAPDGSIVIRVDKTQYNQLMNDSKAYASLQSKGEIIITSQVRPRRNTTTYQSTKNSSSPKKSTTKNHNLYSSPKNSGLPFLGSGNNSPFANSNESPFTSYSSSNQKSSFQQNQTYSNSSFPSPFNSSSFPSLNSHSPTPSFNVPSFGFPPAFNPELQQASAPLFDDEETSNQKNLSTTKSVTPQQTSSFVKSPLPPVLDLDITPKYPSHISYSQTPYLNDSDDQTTATVTQQQTSINSPSSQSGNLYPSLNLNLNPLTLWIAQIKQLITDAKLKKQSIPEVLRKWRDGYKQEGAFTIPGLNSFTSIDDGNVMQVLATLNSITKVDKQMSSTSMGKLSTAFSFKKEDPCWSDLVKAVEGYDDNKQAESVANIQNAVNACSQYLNQIKQTRGNTSVLNSLSKSTNET